MSQPRCGNPVLLEFLQNWYDQARERGDKSYIVYKKACEAMKACPIEFQHPTEAQSLKNIGPRIADRLTESYRVYCRANGLVMPEPGRRKSNVRRRTAGDVDDNDGDAPAPGRKRRKPREYVPKARSGAYALLLALYSDNGEDIALTKEELIVRAQPLCDSSFTTAEPRTFYTAWGSMKTLTDKDLAYANGRPLRYRLTDSGMELAQAMAVAERGGNVSSREDNLPGAREPQPATGSRRKARPSTARASGSQKARSTASRQPPSKGHRLGGDGGHNASLQVARDNNEWLKGLLSKEIDSASAELLDDGDIREVSPPPVHRSLGRPPVSRTSSSTSAVGFRQSRAQSIDPAATANRAASLQVSGPAPTTFPRFEPSVLKAGTFTVELFLDNREVRSKNDRDYIQTHLTSRGVSPTTCPLTLGDFVWVAREKGDAQRTVVLDHIVERKRLDDLVESIRDGRYREQKFRLEKSGIRNVIYIIEECTLSESQAATMESINSAIATMQVVNNFFVKRTSKLDETIGYLVQVTRMLQEKYRHEDLYVIPEEVTDPRTFSVMLAELRAREPRHWCVETSTFSSLMSKSANMTLRDLFLKWLMCVKGVSTEKALAIQGIYRTPIEFIEAFERHGSDAEKKNMVMKALERIDGPPRSKVGSALSARIAQVWAGIED